MPWRVVKTDRCPAGKPWGVVKEGGEVEGCHASREAALKQQAALYASESSASSTPIGEAMNPKVVDGEIRFQDAQETLYELREDEELEMPTLVIHFAVFDEWTEINSRYEGRFLERVGRSAFEKTFSENRRNMRVLFQHGKDPTIGEKILGPIAELRSEERSAYAEVPLYDTSYNRDLIPGLRDNQYGASFRFRAMKEERVERPKASEHNPERLMERTITEAKVMEFGPVTFPAYEGASAGLRSATDWWYEQNLRSQLERLVGSGAAALEIEEAQPEAPPTTAPLPSRSTRDFLQPKEGHRSWELP